MAEQSFPTERLKHAVDGGGGNRTRETFPTHPGWVYLVYDGGWSYKIGHARDPEKRLKLLQTGSPEQLRLVGVVEGSQAHERELHELFAADRVRGEWFVKSREILEYFEENGFTCICWRTPNPDCFIHGEGYPPW